jgi:hydrogenase maturation factor HypF (carbamoyltransferase family)
MNCERCGTHTNITQMSFFNTQTCCPDCITRERAHPEYGRARAEEERALRLGDMNFPGIGLPNDLHG